jgi:predicted ABC-type exoprotein transport system permease subunit
MLPRACVYPTGKRIIVLNAQEESGSPGTGHHFVKVRIPYIGRTAIYSFLKKSTDAISARSNKMKPTPIHLTQGEVTQLITVGIVVTVLCAIVLVLQQKKMDRTLAWICWAIEVFGSVFLVAMAFLVLTGGIKLG